MSEPFQCHENPPTPDTFRNWLNLFRDETGEELTHIQFAARARHSRARAIHGLPVALLGRTLRADDPRVQDALDFEWPNGAKQRPRLSFTAWSKTHTAIWLDSGGAQQLRWTPSRPPRAEKAPRRSPLATVARLLKGITE
jgi:hypothetical protein